MFSWWVCCFFPLILRRILPCRLGVDESIALKISGAWIYARKKSPQCIVSHIFWCLILFQVGNLVQPWEHHNNSSKFIHAIERHCALSTANGALCQVHQSSRYCKIHKSRKRKQGVVQQLCDTSSSTIDKEHRKSAGAERETGGGRYDRLVNYSFYGNVKPASYILYTYIKIGI